MEDSNYRTGKVVNIEYLTQLSKGNTKFVNEMIRIFLVENPEEIRFLEQKIGETDYDQIRATTHKLRSTLPYIGLDRLVEEEVTQIEQLATDKKGIDRIRQLFGKIKETCDRACLELQPA